MKSKSIASIVAIFLAATSVTACSDKSSKSAKPETEAQIYANTKKSLPHADLNVPDSSYQVASLGNTDLFFARLALEKPPIDYASVATSIDTKYANTSDAFKKLEILESLKPRIDQGISNAKSNRYYLIIDNDLRLGHYNFESKSFPIETFINKTEPDSSSVFQPLVAIHNPKVKTPDVGPGANVRVIVTNPEKFTELPVTDNDTARRMEEFVNMNGYDKPYSVQVYTVIQGYPQNEDRKDRLYGEITKIKVVDYKGNLIGETSLKK